MHSRLRVRVDAVLVTAGALVLGGVSPSAPLAALVAALGLFAVLAPRLSRRASVVVLVALAVGAARAWIAVPAFETELLRVRAALGPPKRCSGVARVETSPTMHGDSLGFVAAFESLDCEGTSIGRARARLYGGGVELARGDRVEVVAQLAPTELFRNAELPDPLPPAARSGITLSGGALSVAFVERSRFLPALVDRARAHVRARIDATFPPLAAPLARALVLGENDLDAEDSASFRASGLSHLLAVSGTHLVFAVLSLVNALAFVLARVERLAASRDVGRLAAGFGAVLAPLYADFAGGSGSAVRAALMLTVGLGARALGRRPDGARSFALSVLVGALADPLVGLDVSFMLSAAATAGLLGLGRPLAERFVPEASGSKLRAVLRVVAASTVATVSAMVPCIPLLAGLGPTLTVAGVAANVVAAPFGELVSLPLCLVHAVAYFPVLERGIALVASGALLVVRALARGSASLTWLAVPVPPPTAFHFVVLAVGGVAAFTTPHRRKPLLLGTLAALFVLEGAAHRAGHPKGVLRFTALDVGQGDSALVDLPDGTLVLVDGGGFVGSPVNPGTQVILPILRARRRSRVDVAILSHPHPDHYLGLAATLAAVDVGELWDTGQGRAEGAGPEYHGMLADLARRGVPVRGPDTLCGPPRSFGGVTLRVFSPCPSFEPGLGANDNSFIVKLEHRGRALLLMGDAEHVEEDRLVAEHGGELSADLLKTGHHGSRTSTSVALLRAVRPAAATVSTGIRNRFGHPHPTTLATLQAEHVAALRTDLVGSVSFRTDGDEASLSVFGTRLLDRRGKTWF
ncbi:MAG TPA: ComEC/Rec2 family competence protein [Polyangiaceae bacterium]|nr:ComEC/Rec2 family competence protein [Polyangiaceae bacterium]